MLLGDYNEIEKWIDEGRIDLGFLSLPTQKEFNTISIKQDESMVEKGLGVSILPKLILERIPYNITIRPMSKPFYRNIGIAVKDKKVLSPVGEKFIKYVEQDLM